MKNNILPRLVTFDGEARSGKGTIVQGTKDYLRDEHGHNVMLIDAGQVFRVLVVAAERAGVDMDNAQDLDEFLGDEQQAEKCVQLVKDVYHMGKEQRDALLYTNRVGANSAKVGARPLSQAFKDELLKKWLRDARHDGFDTVLLDGRALEETGQMLENQGLCDFAFGLYFVCDPVVGARRTLGFATNDYDDLTPEERRAVDDLVLQINERNQKDARREVQPIIPPTGSQTVALPDPLPDMPDAIRPMLVVDTSADMTKSAMIMPVAKYVARILQK